MAKIIPFNKQAMQSEEGVALLMHGPSVDEIFMHEVAVDDYDIGEIIPIKDWNAVMWQEFMSECAAVALRHSEGLENPISAWAVFGTVLGELLEVNDEG